MRLLARPIGGVLVTILGGIGIVAAMVAIRIPTAQSITELAERNRREAQTLSGSPFAVAQPAAVPQVNAMEAALTPLKVEPPPITHAPEPAYSRLSLLPPNELALRGGKGWLDNGCFACEIKTDGKQSRWVVQEMTVRVTVFRANRGGVESRLCPLNFVGLEPGEVYTISYSAKPVLYLQPGDRWEWKIVEARGYPIIR